MHGLCRSYGGFFAEPAAATAGFGPPEDEEEYARRIWQEMEKRKRQQSGSAASAACTYFAAETQAKSAREQAAFDAAQRSRKILEDEKAKDRAWREAVSKVLPTIKCLYSVAWRWEYALAVLCPILSADFVKTADQFQACNTASPSVMVLCTLVSGEQQPPSNCTKDLRPCRCLEYLVTPSGFLIC